MSLLRRARTYCPVAVTPQVILKVAVDSAGKVGEKVMPVDCSALKVSGVGCTVTEPTGLDVNVTVVQPIPVAIGSRNTAPCALAGPKLAIVTV